MAAIPTTPASSIAQRLPQMTSGPFNTDFTDVTSPGSVASVDNSFSFESIFTDEELNLTGTLPVSPPTLADDLTMTKTAEVTADPIVDLNDLKGSFDFDLGDSDFFENFTDISNYFLDSEAMDTSAPPETITGDDQKLLEEVFQSLAPVATEQAESVIVSEATEQAGCSKPRKRKAAATTSVETCSSDHSYTVKKRARVEKTTTDDDDDDTQVLTQEKKYRDRRNKNNVASRRSRETRKMKFSHMEEQAVELERSNEELRQRVVELEEMAKEMKEMLIKRLAQAP